MNIIVYTANIGDYDDYYNVYIKEKDIKFLYFTDKEAQVCGWRNVVQNNKHADNTKAARWYKCNSHLLPPHDISIWVDARFRIKSKNISKFVEESLGKKDQIACFYHSRGGSSGCAYTEGFVCAANNIDDDTVIQRQLIKYLDEGFPKKHGLFSTGIIIRRNTPEVQKFNELWWNEVENGSKRDQISQTYSAWKTGLKIKGIEGNVYGNELVNKMKHKHKQNGFKDKYAD